MLAYELFLKNRDRTEGFGKATPVKKIFASFKPSKTIEVDRKSLEEYGGKTTPKTKSLQNLLSMPLLNQTEVCLPDKTTGGKSKKPFLQFYGLFTKTKCGISIKDRNEIHSIALNFEDGKEEFKGTKNIQTRQDKINYFFDGQPLFDAYVKSGILNPKGEIEPETSRQIMEKCIDFLKERIEREENLPRKDYFSIVVLPYDKPVIYQNENSTQDEDKKGFVDSFGQEVKFYANSTTKNAKFLSYDDEAFTVNCTRGQLFYENLGIGNVSIENVGLPTTGKFNISGLDWYFLDLNNPKTEFEQTNRGIYKQLVKNYQTLKSKGKSDSGILKVLCFKVSQAKLEVLIDENVPAKRLLNALMIADGEHESQIMAMEDVLIQRNKDGKAVIWTDYINGVRTILSGRFLERNFLLQLIAKRIRKFVFEYKAKKRKATDIKHFFSKADFCIKLLTKNHGGNEMEANEKIAYAIGEIAGRYINLKRKAKETTNSTEDILAYSKYDRDKLRFVFQRIGQGTSLSKSESLKNDMQSFIGSKKMEEEIGDADASKDYSYFYYKGAFNQLGGEM